MLNARGVVQAGIDALAHSADHRGGGQLDGLARGGRAATAACVRLAKLHDVAGQYRAVERLGRQQLAELNTVGNGKIELFLVGGHLLLSTTVDQTHVLHAGQALGHAGGVHGGVAGADDHDVLAQLELLALLGGLEELQHVELGALAQAGRAGHPGTGGHNHVSKALSLELIDGLHAGVELHLGAKGQAELGVVRDIVAGDTELGDHVTDHTAEGVAGLEDGDGHAGARQEERRRQTGRAATDNGNVALAVVGDGLGAQLGQHGSHGLAGSLELAGADLGALGLVERALAGAAAGMRADGAGDERQGVALDDDVERVLEAALVDSRQVGGNVLLDGAARAARRGKAVVKRALAGDLAVGQRTQWLLVERVGERIGLDRGHGLERDARERLAVQVGKLAGHLAKALVATGLEHVGRQGDGPNAGVVQGADVVDRGAAGVADAQLAVELLGNAAGGLDGQREQRTAGHVHLGGGQLVPRHVDGEGVGQLDAKLQTALGAQGDQALKHGHGVDPLQVLAEVRVIEDDVVKAQLVKALAGKLIAQQRGVALNVGVEALLGDQVGRDALDLGRRAAVQGGLGDGVGDACRDGLDKRGVDMLKLVQVCKRPRAALTPDLGAAGVLHALNIGIDLGALDALQVIAHGHVKDKAVRAAQAILASDQMAGEPCLHVLGKGLRNLELGRPLAVVALVLRHDAGLVDALGKLLAVHNLNGLELKEAGTGHVGCHDILGKLRVGAGGRAKRSLDALVKNGKRALLVGRDHLAHAKDGALGLVLLDDPVHQLRKRDRPHDVAHNELLSVTPGETARRAQIRCSASTAPATPRRPPMRASDAAKHPTHVNLLVN